MVEIVEDWVENGSKQQFLVIAEYGKLTYVRLINAVDKFVEKAKGVMSGYSSDFLYPKS